MKRKLKILLAQLSGPALNINTFRRSSYNIPLACGYLKSYAEAGGLGEDVQIDILPHPLADLGGDGALAAWIARRGYDLAGFSVYQWNALRSLHVMREAKKRNPALRTLAGGPEVSPGTEYLKRGGIIDFLVDGEGEEPFRKLLLSLTTGAPALESIPGLMFRKKGRWRVNTPGEAVRDLGALPSPYLLGHIDFPRYGTMSLETMRGCPYSCRYCSWSRGGRKGVSFFPLERLREEILLARETGIAAIELVDANTNVSREWLRELCAMIRAVNGDGAVELHCFLRPELLDDECVEWLAGAHFSNVIVGLQTTNPDACAAIGRQIDLEDYLRGTESLIRHGITTRPGIILGLPGDTLEGFRKTLAFLNRHGQRDVLCFPLSVSPNSTLRYEAEAMGVRFQKAPPNLVISTPTMSFDDLRAGIRTFRRMFSLRSSASLFEKDARLTGRSAFPRESRQYHATFPSFITYARGAHPGHGAPQKPFTPLEAALAVRSLPPVTRLILDRGSRECAASEARRAAELLAPRLAWNTLVWIEGFRGAEDMPFLRAFLPRLTGENPYHVWHLVLDCERAAPLDGMLAVPALVRRKPGPLDYESLYEQEILAGEHSPASLCLYAVAPLGSPAFSKEWIAEVSQALPLFWSVTLPSLVESVPGEGEGFIIDFAPSVSRGQAMFFLENIRRHAGTRPVFFRNWVVQRVYFQYCLHSVLRWGTDETILEMCAGGAARATPFTDGMLRRQLEQWIRSSGAGAHGA